MSSKSKELYSGELQSKVYNSKSLLVFIGILFSILSVFYWHTLSQVVLLYIVCAIFALIFFLLAYFLSKNTPHLALGIFIFCLILTLLNTLILNLLGAMLFGVASFNLWRLHRRLLDYNMSQYTFNNSSDILDENVF